MTMSKAAAETKVLVDVRIYERQAEICKAFAHPVRLMILDMIAKGEMQSAELQETLGITKANLSQQLAVLKTAGVVVLRREGNQVFCSLAMPEVKQACAIVRKVLQSQWESTRRLLNA
jgi:DNA-binding transcriptional ArsR family regulator